MTSLNPTMRVGRQIAEATGGDDESVRLLEAVGVRDAALRLQVYPHQLSGGLRQRVMAAMAVAGAPRLIVADEPTTALDVTVQAQLLDLLRGLRAEFGCSVLMITHDLAVADQISDRLAVLHHGDLVELGPAATVVRNPQHPYTQSLLAARLSLDTPRATKPTGRPVDRPALEIRDLARTFRIQRSRGRHREVAALTGIDLDVHGGDALAIVGESGSGKSTLLRIVAGLDQPTRGSVQIHGRGGTQMIFQDAGSSLTPWMSVGETLTERLRPTRPSRAEARRSVAEALDRVGLAATVTGARPGELSGGQRQRVARSPRHHRPARRAALRRAHQCAGRLLGPHGA